MQCSRKKTVFVWFLCFWGGCGGGGGGGFFGGLVFQTKALARIFSIRKTVARGATGDPGRCDGQRSSVCGRRR